MAIDNLTSIDDLIAMRNYECQRLQMELHEEYLKYKRNKEMLKAVGDQVLVEPQYEYKSDIIIIPDKYRDQGLFWGLVMSVGPEYHEDVKPGDKVLFNHGEGTPVEFKGKQYLSLSGKKRISGKLVNSN